MNKLTLPIFSYSQSLPFEILVFLDENQLATGEIYWDDGDSLDTYENGDFTHIKFACNSTEFNTETMQNSRLLPIPKMHAVIITGLNKKPFKVFTVNCQELKDFMYDTNLQIRKSPYWYDWKNFSEMTMNVN